MISCVQHQPEERLPLLTERLVDTYAEVGATVHLGRYPLPNYDAVISIAEDLKAVLFPGYRRRDGLHLGNLTYHVGNLVDTLHARLAEQIARALGHEARRQCPEDTPRWEDLEALARRKTMTFLEQLSSLRKALSLDAEAAYAGDPACRSLDEVVFCYPGFEAITIHRLAHLLYKLDIPLIPRMMSEWAHGRTGIDIHPGAQIGRHFRAFVKLGQHPCQYCS